MREKIFTLNYLLVKLAAYRTRARESLQVAAGRPAVYYFYVDV
jgi:hypothetical protein